MSPRPPFRVGLGYDSHRLGNGGPLRIGGMDIPAEVHAIGHSDADVLLHAITDALLGSVAAPDIGRLFPDNAAENRGRNSSDFVAEAMHRVRSAGYELVNIDAVILAERPKMAPHIDDLRQTIGRMLDLPTDGVGLKAKTGETVGVIGQGAAIAARCVVMIQVRTSVG
ncbi:MULTISPECIES: 2-C-methyl-D-erythritol 2,4-cyclodiphosphate synthase [Crateriforma]|uniref:2-C-methyl-D-erythritol 2,4-cyclodiphosphate synthase n=1 Tax=Crateriforma conspicua TaxID=2527996 RepID=A0A5C6FTH6_9PLAN|nr:MULTISPECIES: 2-C-methyl-D-erythritol 2,4-cyclodiphosphate synthase [Crateriforma]TWU64770.1 2-C-methyl-D-erythritol 2,4-cyclodiphosphate synthase [Crateriforma conspicua]